MRITNYKIDGLLKLHHETFPDERGLFCELQNKTVLDFLSVSFVQQNLAVSSKKVIRGLHWQRKLFSQGKLVTCVSGEIYDVAVDLRRDSKTFGEYQGIYLSEKEPTSIWIPKGFAHGYQALQNNSRVIYSVTEPYSKENSLSMNPFDHTLNINWPFSSAILSKNDMNSPSFNQISDSEFF